jgi:hypothetical protein
LAGQLELEIRWALLQQWRFEDFLCFINDGLVLYDSAVVGKDNSGWLALWNWRYVGPRVAATMLKGGFEDFSASSTKAWFFMTAR